LDPEDEDPEDEDPEDDDPEDESLPQAVSAAEMTAHTSAAVSRVDNEAGT